MRSLPNLLVSTILLLTTATLRAEPLAGDDTADDEKLLRAAKVPTDAAGLLEFLRKRTGKDADLEQIATLVRQLGDDSFTKREEASLGLVAVGWPALSSLRRALDDPDEEIKERARHCIASITRGPDAGTTASAVRLLRSRKPDGAPAALLAFLPFSESPAVEEEAFFALASLGVREGKVEPLFVDALKSKLPERRAAAALVLGRSGTAEQKGLVRPLLADADPRVRFRAAQGLIAGRDKSAVPALVALLTDAPPRTVEQAEDLLICLAGNQSPRVSPGDSAASRKRCHDAWAAWWKTAGGQLDLTRMPTDLPGFNPALRVREVGRQFLAALMRGDVPGLKRTTDAPFVVGVQGTVYKTREELDTFLDGIGPTIADQKAQLTRTNLISLDEYARIAPDNEKQLVASLRKGDVRVLCVQLQLNGGTEEAALFIRSTPGPVRIVGVGQGKQNRPPR